jgi:hypothetical protein
VYRPAMRADRISLVSARLLYESRIYLL